MNQNLVHSFKKLVNKTTLKLNDKLTFIISVLSSYMTIEKITLEHYEGTTASILEVKVLTKYISEWMLSDVNKLGLRVALIEHAEKTDLVLMTLRFKEIES